MRPLRTMSTVAGHRKLTTANREHHRSWTSQLHEKLPKNSTMTILWSNSLWSKLKRWKSSISTCLVSWPKIKKLSFWNVIFSYFVQQQWTISRLGWLWHAMKSIFYTTTGENQLSGWTEKKLQSISQSQTCTKTMSQSLVVCASLIHYSFVILAEHYMWEVCSASRRDASKTATPAAGLQKGPNSSPRQHLTIRGTTNASEIEWIGLQSFASSAIFTWPLDNQIPLLQSSWQLFAGKMFPLPAEGRKCFPRVCRIPKHWFLHYRNIPTYSSGKNVLILMVPILINKDMFDPSYNDLKFMV